MPENAMPRKRSIDADWVIPNPTGISSEYWNEYNRFYMLLEAAHSESENFALVLDSIKKLPIKHYEEKFSPDTYEYDLSNPRIDLLNQIADCINHRVAQNRMDARKLFALCDCVFEIIRGRPLPCRELHY